MMALGRFIILFDIRIQGTKHIFLLYLLLSEIALFPKTILIRLLTCPKRFYFSSITRFCPFASSRNKWLKYKKKIIEIQEIFDFWKTNMDFLMRRLKLLIWLQS